MQRILLGALALLAASGCAVPTEGDEPEAAAAGENALEEGASLRSGLKPGAYDGDGVSLAIESRSEWRQLATLTLADGSDMSAFVNVHLFGGKVVLDWSIRGMECDVRLDVEGDVVGVEGTCNRRRVKATLVRREPAAALGTFACSEGGTSRAALLHVTRADARGVTGRFEPIARTTRLKGELDAKWAVPATIFDDGELDFELWHTDRITWRVHDADSRSGQCTRVR